MKALALGLWILLVCTALWAKLYSPGAYALLTGEDIGGELAQAVCYLLAGLVSVGIAVGLSRRRVLVLSALYGLLALGLLLVAMEEWSWGQRSLSIETPEYFREHNVQGELTLHNLSQVQPHLRKLFIAIGAYGSFAWLVLALLRRFGAGRLARMLEPVVPPWYIAIYFLPCMLVYAWLHYIGHPLSRTEWGRGIDYSFWGYFRWRDEEIGELFLSLGFLLFVILNAMRLRHFGREPAVSRPGRGASENAGAME